MQNAEVVVFEQGISGRVRSGACLLRGDGDVGMEDAIRPINPPEVGIRDIERWNWRLR